MLLLSDLTKLGCGQHISAKSPPI